MGVDGPFIPPEPDLSGESLGGFLLVHRMGTDDAGALYAAEGHAGPCAVRVLPSRVTADATRRATFHREVELLRGLRHPGLIHVVSSGEERGRCWYAMVPLSAPDLRTRLDWVNALPWQEVERIAFQLLDALGAAHDAGLVHGNLSPESVLVGADGAKLWRFGLGVVPPGAHGYQAPEQRLRGRAVVQSDLHVLGRLLHEALTGGEPGSQPLPRGVPRRLRRFLKRLLAERIEDRPDSTTSARRLLSQRFPIGLLALGGAMLVALGVCALQGTA
ncbi:hypothetical protein GCM10012319_02120 [Comamonas sp. KCTC 72670]|nr:hypothetical protein GCM10012319_02120 [Comamonas sp. KCTC 72670]